MLCSGSPPAHRRAWCSRFSPGATGLQDPAAGWQGHSRRAMLSARRSRDSQSRLCGYRRWPAIRGPFHISTTRSACCRRKWPAGSAGRFSMVSTAGAGRSGHAPYSSHKGMFSSCITAFALPHPSGSGQPGDQRGPGLICRGPGYAVPGEIMQRIVPVVEVGCSGWEML